MAACLIAAACCQSNNTLTETGASQLAMRQKALTKNLQDCLAHEDFLAVLW